MSDTKRPDSEQQELNNSRVLRNRFLGSNPEYTCRLEAQQAILGRALEDIGVEERGIKIPNLPLACDEIVPPRIPACVRGGKNHCREA